MKYRALQSFLAFGKAPQRGEYVELTDEQAEALDKEGLIAPYEIKIQPVPENKEKKKQLESQPAAPVLPVKIAKRSGRTAKK